MRDRQHRFGDFGSPFLDPTAHQAVAAHSEYPVTAVLPTDATVVYMTLRVAKQFGLRWPQFGSGRRRGGTFPRWRWQKKGANVWSLQAKLGESFGCATVMLEENRWVAWHTDMHLFDTSKRFARRCDAKRWCELMLATRTHGRKGGRIP